MVVKTGCKLVHKETGKELGVGFKVCNPFHGKLWDSFDECCNEILLEKNKKRNSELVDLDIENYQFVNVSVEYDENRLDVNFVIGLYKPIKLGGCWNGEHIKFDELNKDKKEKTDE